MFGSRYNLITDIDGKYFAIFNPLSGAFDIADNVTKDRFMNGEPSDIEEKLNWIERGYFFNSADEEEKYLQERYAEFLEETSKNPVQFLLVETYSCNFDCAYCYQKGVSSKDFIPAGMITAFVDHIVKFRKETGKEVFVSLFGGEPLLSGDTAKRRVELLTGLLSDNGIGLSVVTNGYNLSEYIGILKKADIREIHVSLDGAKPVHDRRRFTKDGNGSFDRIISGIREAVANKMPVNIRLIIDRITLESLPELAECLEKEGFLDLPKNYFKTSLGRNYELINQYMKKEDLFTMDEMIRGYAALMMRHPVLRKLHIPSFFGITHMIETGEMYLPNFDSCPATKSEFVFDGTGKIYGCTASCGRNGYEIGTYFPEVKFNDAKIEEWKNRSILAIEKCRDCDVGVVCGGGCGVIAKEKSGTVLSPNCKPVKEVMDAGIRFYKDILLQTEV
jgi:uncharacterized protein